MLGEYPKGRRISNLPCNAEFLQDGEEVYPAMLAAIANAEQRIHLESYMVFGDIVGWRFARALAERARAGVDVRMLIDAVGSYDLPHSYVTYLRRAGVKVAFFNPLKIIGGGPFFARNHRKTLTVDGKIGFVGGLNIGTDHIRPPLGQGWHDAAVRLTGEAVLGVDDVFAASWRRMFKGHDAPHAALHAATANEEQCEILSNRVFSHRFEIRRRYLLSIRQAKERIIIANAYFLPDPSVRRALRHAVTRGVRVQLLLPAHVDVPLLKLAQFGFFEKFLAAGFEIYEWPGTMLHHKVALFDERELAIGSYNLDRRSLRHNLEISVWLRRSPAVAAACAALTRDIGLSERRVESAWKKRTFGQRFVHAFAFLLRDQF